MSPRSILVALLSSFAFTVTAAPPVSTRDLPHLEKRGSATQLIVEGQPFLALAGELHNSSSTSRAYMAPIWPKLVQMNLNTVLATVPWGLVEPQEGKFDFSLVDGLLEDARAHHLRLVLLWFGSWKNGLSHYVPTWVKSDARRFPRVRTRPGTLEILTPLSDANREADAKAFAAFMRHVHEADAAQHTVIMIQVENEVGMHADSRDRSEIANTAWSQAVPPELMTYLQQNRDSLRLGLRALWQSPNFRAGGTWEEVFGRSHAAEEAFMAWHYARFVNRVVEAGKAEYPLPMFVNAWIVQPEDETPGEYPSGGPQAHVHDLWRAGAPLVDILAPDIYLPNFTDVCAQYARPGQAFFVPESRAGTEGAANAVVAIGAFNGLGYSPFGIESRETDPVNGGIPRVYALLRSLAPLILEQQAQGRIAGVSLTAQNTSQRLTLGNVTLQIALLANRRTNQVPERGYALVLATGPDEFLVAGSDVQITFAPYPTNDDTIGLANVEEGSFENGNWKAGRNLNGDEIMISYDLPTMAGTHQTGTGLKFPGTAPTLQRAKLYRFPPAK